MTVIDSRLIWAANREGDDGRQYKVTHSREGQAGHGLDWLEVVRVYVREADPSRVGTFWNTVIVEKAFDHVSVANASLYAAELAASVKQRGSLWRKLAGRKSAPLSFPPITSDLEKTNVESNRPKAKRIRKPKFTLTRK